MKRSKSHKESSFSNQTFKTFLFLWIIVTLFFMSFYLVFIFSSDNITRNRAVNIEEEADYTNKSLILSGDELNYLYKKEIINSSTKSIEKYFLENPIIILAYHQIREINWADSKKARLFITTPETFEKQMKYLKDNKYTAISISEYINYLNNFEELKNIYQNKKLIVLTFDDGYISQYKNAFPIMQKYGFTGTFFIYNNCINKYLACMNTEELKDLVLNKNHLANHTENHIYLPNFNLEIVKKEIINNEIWLDEFFLKNNLDKKYLENILAYPYGGNNENIRGLLKDLNYLGAVGVASGYEINNKNLFNLKRYLLGNDFNSFLKIFKS